MTSEEFEVIYGEFTFESSFEGQGDIELCPGGKEKKLTKDNASEYIELWLKTYTRLESAQFTQIYYGIQDVCGKNFLLHLTPKLAEKRACAAATIDVESIKLVTNFYATNEAFKDRFWKVVGSFSNQDRSLLVKFATGRTRLAQGDRMEIRSNPADNEARLPTAGTCSNYMNVPEYSTDEILSKNLLIAVRLCGNIDNDGGGGGVINMEDDAIPDAEDLVRGEQD